MQNEGKILIVNCAGPTITRGVRLLLQGLVWNVVGVVGDIKSRGLDLPEPLPTLHVPSAQSPHPRMSLVVRVQGPVSGVVIPLTRAIHELDQQQPVNVSGPMEEVIASSFVAVSRLASVVPAYRATQVEPLKVLRDE